MDRKAYAWPELNTKLTDVFDGVRGDMKDLFYTVVALKKENRQLRENAETLEKKIATLENTLKKEKNNVK